MAKAVAKSKKIPAKSKPSATGRAKAAPVAPARKVLTKGPAKPVAKPVVKPVAKQPAKPAVAEPVKAGKWVYTFGRWLERPAR
jgi:pyruvate,orthophosphate dikinase